MEDYRIVADEISADVEAGRLRPGDRLPPQRRFARERGIANSTAARVYGELVRRGVVVGEVGRGTFVRAGRPPLETALAEPGGATVDLELNFAVLPEQSALVGKALEPLLRDDVLTAALRPGSVSGSKQARDAVAGLLARDGWTPEILFAGSGRQAIAAAIAAFVPMGERLAVEAITYPVVKALAGRLGVQLCPSRPTTWVSFPRPSKPRPSARCTSSRRCTTRSGPQWTKRGAPSWRKPCGGWTSR